MCVSPPNIGRPTRRQEMPDLQRTTGALIQSKRQLRALAGRFLPDYAIDVIGIAQNYAQYFFRHIASVIVGNQSKYSWSSCILLDYHSYRLLNSVSLEAAHNERAFIHAFRALVGLSDRHCG